MCGCLQCKMFCAHNSHFPGFYSDISKIIKCLNHQIYGWSLSIEQNPITGLNDLTVKMLYTACKDESVYFNSQLKFL